MMNHIWAWMMLIAVFFAVINGKLQEFSSSLLESCEAALYFMIGLGGIMAVWSGIMNIAKESGLIQKVSKLARPIVRFLFPGEKDEETISLMMMSFIANFFGAGNSTTVFSIQAMKRLDAANGCSERASNTMCMFTIINMSMVQLIPITVIKIRNEAGSVTPEDIVFPSLIVSAFTLIVSIAICKYYERKDLTRNA